MIICFLVIFVSAMNFVGIQHGIAEAFGVNTTNSEERQTRVDLQSNPNFTFFNETSELPTDWIDGLGYCHKYYNCTVKLIDGWNDYVSFSVSTTNNTNGTWSWIYGKDISVSSKQRVQIVTHMKLNNWTSLSHIVLQGFNQITDQWYQMIQCPSGINGPLEWREFSCTVTIPSNTTKIRSILNAGWSSKSGEEATTWFDSINLLTKSTTRD